MCEENQPPVTWMSCHYHRQHLLRHTHSRHTHTHTHTPDTHTHTHSRHTHTHTHSRHTHQTHTHHTHTPNGFEECLSDATLRSESSTRLEEQQQPLSFQHSRNKELLVWWAKKTPPKNAASYCESMEWLWTSNELNSDTHTHTLLQQALLWKWFSLWIFWVTKQIIWNKTWTLHLKLD